MIKDLALQYEDGFIYRGKGIAPQTRQGFGILTDQDEKEVYSGFWKDNQYHGEGRLFNLEQEFLNKQINWRDMTSISNFWKTYEGEFENGKMNGKGILILTNNEKYEGGFFDGMVQGSGTFTSTSGEVINGNWLEGQFQDYL